MKIVNTLILLFGMFAAQTNAMLTHFSHEAGMGGAAFHVERNLSGVKTISVQHGDHIDAIKFSYHDGTCSEHFGGCGGCLSHFHVREGDYIKKVNVWAGRGTNAIQFETVKMESSRIFGNTECAGSDFFCFEAKDGQDVMLVLGRSGEMLDKISFEFASKDSFDKLSMAFVNA